MKRAMILVVAISMILTGCFMDSKSTNAEINAGSHYLKGQVVALEGCYSNATDHGATCVGIVNNSGHKSSGHIQGDIQIGEDVYKECVVTNGDQNCSSTWKPSVGEDYLVGGEIFKVQ